MRGDSRGAETLCRALELRVMELVEFRVSRDQGVEVEWSRL